MSLGSLAGGGTALPSSLPPSGAAGGDLGGTYPNPSVTDDSHSHTAATLPTSAVPLVSFLAANATNATVNMAASGLTVTVATGVKYAVDGVLLMAESTAADGGKFDFDTSTAGVTAMRLVSEFVDAGGSLNFNESTTLAGDHFAPGFTGSDATVRVLLVGSFEPSSNGTFLLRIAKNSHTTGMLTLYRGSWLMLTPMG